MESKQRAGEPTIYNVESADVAMNQAIEKARLTLEEFNTALLSKNPNNKSFALKVRFGTHTGGEHIWVSEVSIKDNEYYGLVDNQPASTSEITIDEPIQIDKRSISDWMYLHKKKVQGGFTIKLLRQRMDSVERINFDKETGLVFEI